MAHDTPIVCRQCGFTNVPGDEFCGSCGTFLEWTGTPADDATADAVPAVDVVPAVVDLPQPIVTTPVATDADAGDLVRCAACGTANPSSRTFCQSCGTTLATAARVEPATQDQIAKAVAWTPGQDQPPGGKRPAGAGAGATSDKRGIPGWVPWIAVIGVLVGVALVLAGVALRGQNPQSGATGTAAAPSGPASGRPGSSGGASTPPGTAVAIPLTRAKASSIVGNQAKFRAEQAIDGDPATSWQEGSRQEKGEWIEVTFDPSRVDTLLVRNGYQASQALFRGNRRLKDILVAVNGGSPIQARLKDTMSEQEVDLGGVSGATRLRITIVSTYPAEKTSIPKTPFDDAALSEISVLGVPGG